MSNALHPHVGKAPEPAAGDAGTPSGFGEEWRQSLQRPGFFIAVARELVPVFGVLFLGWPALVAAIYFIVESWLFLSLRAATEIVIDPKYAGKDLPRSTLGAVAQIVKHLTYVLPFFALLLGLFAGFVLMIAFPRPLWDAFLGGEWRAPEVLWSFAVLVVTLVADTVRHARRFATRSGDEALVDDLNIKLMFYRVTFGLFPAAFLLGFLRDWTSGPALIVLVMAVLSIAMEAVPRSMVAWLEEPSKKLP